MLYEELTEEEKAELFWSNYYKYYEPEYEIPDPDDYLDDEEVINDSE